MMGRLFIERLMTVAESANFVTEEESIRAESFASEHRRREFLTWHAVVRRELGRNVEIGYNEAGAPVVNCPGVNLGVAHSGDLVAVGISERICAVDIESVSRDFSKAAVRCMSVEERMLSSDPLLPAVLWCAKETLYKYSGRTGLDLLKDLHVLEVDLKRGIVIGQIENEKPVELIVRRYGDYIVVYIL